MELPAKFAAAIPRRCFASIVPDKPRAKPKSTVRFVLNKCGKEKKTEEQIEKIRYKLTLIKSF